MTLSDFYFKKLGKMIDDKDYDLNERYVPRLLDLGYIKLKRGFFGPVQGFHLDYSYYDITELGKTVYEEWKNEQK